MKCQRCGKKEATVRYKENINGNKQEIFLCADCADKMGFTDFSNIFSPIFVPMSDIFIETKPQKCSKCGYTLEDYSKTGMFGCEECYNTFEDTLDELFLKIHGKNRHIKLRMKKKESIKTSKEKQIEELKDKIQDLIKEEKYEEAAIIRDKIKELER